MSAQAEVTPEYNDDAVSYELPDYETVRLRSWRPDEKKIDDSHRGTVYTDVVRMTDGHTYPVVMGVPREPETDIPVVFTTAWFTSTMGHNRHTLLRFMEQGIPGVLIGSEGVHRRRHERLFNPLKCAKQLGSIALSSSAYNMHEILDEIPSCRGIDTERIMLLGESRGAMVGMGVLAYAQRFNRQVVHADLVAPCFPKKLELSDIPDMLEQIGEEPKQVLKFLGAVSLARLLHYPSTIDLHPKSLAFQLATAPALFGGEAGDMARHIPKEQPLHLTTFEGDFASMSHIWDEIFEAHSRYTHTVTDGAHLSIVDEKTLAAIEKRIEAGFPKERHLKLA